MRRTTVYCPCGVLLANHDQEDGKEFSLQEFVGECPDCSANKGDYTKSPHWRKDEKPKEEKEHKVAPKRRGF